MSQAPARIAGLDGHGGTLAVGDAAHVTLVDPDASVTVDRAASVSLSRNNPWHDRQLASRVVHTVFAGRQTVIEGVVQQG
jgi:dihydroorotase